MKVFVFGAGASKASQVGNTLHPFQISPLSNDITKSEYHVYAKEIGFSASSLASFANFESSLEEHLTRKWNEIENYKSKQRKEAEWASLGRFTLYLWKLLNKVSETYTNENLYRVLLSKIEERDEDFGIINFNYDLFLERAYNEVFGYEFHDLKRDYIDKNYIKPHGSVNWFLSKRTQDPTFDIAEHNMDTNIRLTRIASYMYQGPAHILDNLKIIDPLHRDLNSFDDIVRGRFSSTYFYPLIFIPLTVKAYKLVEGFEGQILEKAKEMIRNADEIIVIGYRANDDVIIDLLKSVSPLIKTTIVSSVDASEIANRIEGWTQVKPAKVLSNGFENYVNNFHIHHMSK